VVLHSDVVFTGAFTLEAALKVAAFGFRPYVGFFQNQVDLLIVVSSLVMLVLDTISSLSVVKVRVWRVLWWRSCAAPPDTPQRQRWC
jgi:hypothetical protein